MSNAFKCDRCGKYGTERLNVRRGIEFFSFMSICTRSYDLCVDCYQKVIRFIEDEKAEEEVN